ncbi:MAG: hypothetical protein ACK4IX_08905, partial [Candidatus Sericytochromatia bacterium]
MKYIKSQYLLLFLILGCTHSISNTSIDPEKTNNTIDISVTSSPTPPEPTPTKDIYKESFESCPGYSYKINGSMNPIWSDNNKIFFQDYNISYIMHGGMQCGDYSGGNYMFKNIFSMNTDGNDKINLIDNIEEYSNNSFIFYNNKLIYYPSYKDNRDRKLSYFDLKTQEKGLFYPELGKFGDPLFTTDSNIFYAYSRSKKPENTYISMFNTKDNSKINIYRFPNDKNVKTSKLILSPEGKITFTTNNILKLPYPNKKLSKVEISMINPITKEKVDLFTKEQNNYMYIGDFKWSPDGKKLGFILNTLVKDTYTDGEAKYTSELYIIEKGQNNKILLLDNYQNTYFNWSPNSKKIVLSRAFFRENPNVSYSDIYSIDVDNGNLTQLTNSKESKYFIGNSNPSYSPDGSKILFISNRASNFSKIKAYFGVQDIYIMDSNGQNQKRLT